MILTINSTNAELNHLAAAVAEKGLLTTYVRPYANLNRSWERMIANVPGISSLYGRTFGRRIMPPGLKSGDIHEAAIAEDMAIAAMRHLVGTHSKSIIDWLHWRIQKRLANVGASYAARSSMVVANYLVAEPAFRRTDGIRVLNYPIAHHRYIQRFVAEEAEREPEFAGTLPDWNAEPSWIQKRLDAECGLADTILVGSTFTRDSFITEGLPSEKLTVLPYGADVNAFTPKPYSAPRSKNDEFRLLFVGQIGQRKGLSYLLRAYKAFRSPNTRLTLVGGIYGDGEGLIPYRQLFEHVPHMPKAELAEQYRRADVFVFPTLIEGLGIVVLEAMASGLPIITTPNGPGDIVRDGIDGYVVPIRDADAILEKLEFLRANPDLRREMGRNARKRALEYSWSNYRSRISTELLRQLGSERNQKV